MGWNNQRAPAANFHALHTLVPALNHLPAAQEKLERVTAIQRAIEFAAVTLGLTRVIQPAAVMHFNAIADLRLSAVAHLLVSLDQIDNIFAHYAWFLSRSF